MEADLVSSAAYEIQLTADCELLLLAQLAVVKDAEAGSLEKAANRLAGDAKTDDPAGRIDVGDRVGGNEAAMAGEDTGADRERIGDVRQSAVHRALDLADHPSAVVGHQEPGRVHEIQRECGHGLNLIRACKEIPFPRVRVV